MNRWFGPPAYEPFAEVCKSWEHVPVPVGEPCAGCQKVFEGSELGFSIDFIGQPGDPTHVHYHWGCFLEMVGFNPAWAKRP